MNIGIHTTNFLEDNKVYSELLVLETYTIKDEESKNAIKKQRRALDLSSLEDETIIHRL